MIRYFSRILVFFLIFCWIDLVVYYSDRITDAKFKVFILFLCYFCVIQLVLLAAIIAVSQAVVIPGAGVVAAPAYHGLGGYPGYGYPGIAKVCQFFFILLIKLKGQFYLRIFFLMKFSYFVEIQFKRKIYVKQLKVDDSPSIEEKYYCENQCYCYRLLHLQELPKPLQEVMNTIQTHNTATAMTLM